MSDLSPPKRTTYRHGDLRHALIAAGTELARGGGPNAVVLREATRRVGVAPNAAYRHFADRRALLDAVCAAAQSLLAVAIERELASVPATGDPADVARARLRAVGTGYVRFALKEPGLFRAAFVSTDLEGAYDPARAGASGQTPFQLLGSVLDELVDAGALPKERRPRAEFLAWSSVHGVSMLLIDGPLRALDRKKTHALVERLLDMVVQGL
ncbi:MAG TPA: TetR/AcrR family transcriptional regulator [Gaiellaceae bacterium]|jgi:AcrR family transcriptional regulator|nr:TetR/AcrR family transcriptional regulator [Gaiellaceae bacterium]